MVNYDVIIVGGGPAGTTAGYLLGKWGIPTLLIDKSFFPRRKLCGGALTNKTMKLLHRIFHENADTLSEKGIINYVSYDYDIFFREKLMVHGTSPFPFCFVDRYAYDDYLLRKTKDIGVTVLEGEKVVSLDAERNELFTETGKKLHARFIIGADGANSVIRRNFPDDLSQKKHWGQNLATALEIFIPRSELQQGTDHPIIHFGYINWGYSWVFPNKDEIIIGLGGLNRKNDKRFKELFKNYIAEIVPSYQPDESQQKRIYGHPVPSGNYLRNPVYKSIMLVGDAAGFSDTISGEGIFQAQRSAEIASLSIYRSLNDGQPLKESYLKLLKKHMFPELFYAKLLRWFIFTALEKLNFNLIQMLTIRGEKRAIDIIHGLRTYKFMRRSEGIHDGILWGM